MDDGQTHGWLDGIMLGWIEDAWMEEWMDVFVCVLLCLYVCLCGLQDSC